MVVNGKIVATLTGTDVEAMKERLFRTYFHFPTQSKPTAPVRKRKLKKRRK